MDIASLIILLFVVGVFGYCGGKKHGFHKLLKDIGLELEEKHSKKDQLFYWLIIYMW